MQRLSKILQSYGIASRRKAEEIIFNDRITVNNKTVNIPQTLVSDTDKIKIDGTLLTKKEDKVYYMLNKPKGYTCSNCTTVKKRVIDLFPNTTRVFTVGRLDKDTVGLIFVTNDGQFTNNVIHPSNDVEKEYLVKTNKPITHKHLIKISKGAFIEGKTRVPLSVKKIRKNVVKIIIKEGKKHEVRIFIKKADLRVLELKRIRIGFLLLGKLKEGTYKKIRKQDVLRFLNSK